jgi:hypothetical protein
MHNSARVRILAAVVVSLMACCLISCSKAERDWRTAQRNDNEQSYAAYLQSHADSSHAAKARERRRHCAGNRRTRRPISPCWSSICATTPRLRISKRPRRNWTTRAGLAPTAVRRWRRLPGVRDFIPQFGASGGGQPKDRGAEGKRAPLSYQSKFDDRGGWRGDDVFWRPDLRNERGPQQHSIWWNYGSASRGCVSLTARWRQVRLQKHEV